MYAAGWERGWPRPLPRGPRGGDAARSWCGSALGCRGRAAGRALTCCPRGPDAEGPRERPGAVPLARLALQVSRVKRTAVVREFLKGGREVQLQLPNLKNVFPEES